MNLLVRFNYIGHNSHCNSFKDHHRHLATTEIPVKPSKIKGRAVLPYLGKASGKSNHSIETTANQELAWLELSKQNE